jgi:hypothetical protein
MEARLLGSMLDGAVYYSFGYPGGELGLKSYQTTSTMRPRWSGVLKFTLQLDAVFEYGRSQLSKRAQLLHRIDTNPEAGLIARGGIHVQRALLDCLVERGHRLPVGLFGGLFVALFNGLSQAAQCGAQAGGICAISGRALRGLTGALKRRKMICHV